MIAWPPSVADVVAVLTVFLAIGSAIMNAVHGYFARQRMFTELNFAKKKVRVLWGLAIAEGKIKPTITGYEDEEDTP
jgi:hypothetical protein